MIWSNRISVFFSLSCEEIYRYISYFLLFIISAVVFNEISASRRMLPVQGDVLKYKPQRLLELILKLLSTAARGQ